MKDPERRGKIPGFLVVAAVWLAAGGSFAADAVKVDLEVELNKTPRIKTAEYEFVDDVEIGTEKDKETYITSESYTLDMTLSTRGKKEALCRLEWYFIAQRIKGEDGSWREELEVVDGGEKEIKLDASGVVNHTATYEFLLFEKVTTGTYDVAIDPETGKFPEWAPDGTGEWEDAARNGVRYAGYLVLVTANGKIIAKETNSYRFGKDKWIEQCRSASLGRTKRSDNVEWRKLYNRWWPE